MNLPASRPYPRDRAYITALRAPLGGIDSSMCKPHIYKMFLTRL